MIFHRYAWTLSRRVAYDHDPELGWIPHANSVRQQTTSRIVTQKHNSLGLRDIDLAPSAGSTILFLGSSFVYGIEVEAEERFTEQLRSSLPGVRIVNAGVAGYSNDQEYVLLERLWSRIEPNVVVLIWGPGDRDGNVTNFRFHAFKPYLERIEGRWQMRGQPVPKGPTQYFYNNWFANRFAIVRLGVLAYWSRFNYRRSIPDPSEQLVSMMQDFAKTRGAKFMVGLISRDQTMQTFLTAQAIPHVILDEAEQYPEYGRHWTPAGHASVAERLKTLLSFEGALPPAAANR